MKRPRVTVAITIFGERYNLTGEPEKINQAVTIFREAENMISRRHAGREVSTHRLSVLAGLALAEEVVVLRRKGERASSLARQARRALHEAREMLGTQGEKNRSN